MKWLHGVDTQRAFDYNAIIMTQKLIRIGTSVGVVIPKNLMHELGLKIGGNVILDSDKRRRGILIRPTHMIDNELVDWTKNFIEVYRQSLEALAGK